MTNPSLGRAAARCGRAVALATAALAALTLSVAGTSRAEPAAADPGAATVVLAVRSIGSKRGEPLDPRVHAALLVRLEGRAGGFIVQGGPEPVPGGLFGTRRRVVGWAIPAQDPSVEFTRAVGGFWGEPDVREVPTREIARFAVKGLTEARLREIVDSLNQELRDRDYRLDGGPSSNSFVSRLLDRLGLPLPPLGGEQLPGWGWRP
jgi:hypothetical protein